ncbi:MAG: hypothetical protein AMXMBFR83_27740 [Phycisphaerae bacterium]
MLCWSGAGVALLSGCSASSELQEARRQTAECRLELEALRRQLKDQPNAALIKAQRDRLEVQCTELRTEIARLRAQARAQPAPAAPPSPSDAQRFIQELQKRVETLQAEFLDARTDWERTLADRQRRIDVLANQVERLERELAAARPPAGTRPGR